MRYNTINQAIQDIDATCYLEIGFFDGGNFDKIRCKSKIAVDPAPTIPNISCIISDSDSFFSAIVGKAPPDLTFDVIFIDGLHVYEQVKRDFDNSIKVLNKGGAICLHDTSPQSKEWARSFAEGGIWNGDCYKLVIDLYAGIYKFKYYTVNEDHGVTVVFPDRVEDREVKPFKHDYEWFDARRAEILNII